MPTVPKFKVTNQVTFPLLKFVNNKPAYFKFDTDFFEGKELKGGGKTDMGVPTLARGVDLETQQPCEIICSMVFKDTIEEHYPENSYIGKAFEIIKKPKATGKSYSTYSIAEVEVEYEDVDEETGEVIE